LSNTEKLDAALRIALALPDEMNLTGIAYGETEEWDSVAHMQLVAAVENAFGIMLETDDVIAMSDYRAVRAILRDHHDIAFDA
jgi:acyl carrier protein